MLVLALLIVSWFLRTCAPVDLLFNVAVLETDPPPASQSPPNNTPALRASLRESMSDGSKLASELASLQVQFKIKVASCEPAPLPSDRWANKDLSILKGCWVLGRDTRSWRGDIGSPEREDNCTIKASRMCFDANGRGQTEMTTVCPLAGAIYCARPITAQFANEGTFTATSPSTQCQRGTLTHWQHETISCRRVDDYHAMCKRTNFTRFDRPGTQFEEVEFRREL